MIAQQNEAKSKTLKNALSSPIAKEWNNALDEEIESIKINQVWDLVDLSQGHKTIRNKWVLKVKHKADGSIENTKLA